MKAFVAVTVWLVLSASIGDDPIFGKGAPPEPERSRELDDTSPGGLAETVRLLQREVSELRERVAVLEARDAAQLQQELPKSTIEELISRDPEYQLLQQQLLYYESLLTSRETALKNSRSNSAIRALRKQCDQLQKSLQQRRTQLLEEAAGQQMVPRNWKKKYFNGVPYYIVPLNSNGDEERH